MKLITPCPNCKKDIKIPSFWIGDRIELAKSKGAEFEVMCNSCNCPAKIHVDDVRAENDKTVPIIGVLTFLSALFLTYWLWQYGFIAYATIALPIIASASARQNQHTKIKQFNLMYYDSKRLRK